MAAVFYQNLFTAQQFTNPDEVVRFVPEKVTDLHNNSLCSPFTAVEVRKALFMMKPNKAPGPNGFTASFYQRHWDLLGEDISRAVLEFLNGGNMPSISGEQHNSGVDPQGKKPARFFSIQTNCSL